MHGTLQKRVDAARKIERRICQGTDKIVRREKFSAVCKVLWPLNTAATIASFAGKDERTGARWLAGEFTAHPKVFAAILLELASDE